MKFYKNKVNNYFSFGHKDELVNDHTEYWLAFDGTEPEDVLEDNKHIFATNTRTMVDGPNHLTIMFEDEHDLAHIQRVGNGKVYINRIQTLISADKTKHGVEETWCVAPQDNPDKFSQELCFTYDYRPKSDGEWIEYIWCHYDLPKEFDPKAFVRKS